VPDEEIEWPGDTVADVGGPINPKKVDDALKWLKARVDGVGWLTRPEATEWDVSTSILGARIKYSGAADVTWTVPADLNPSTTRAAPVKILQGGAGRVTLDLAAYLGVNKPSTLSPVRTAGAGRALLLLIGPAGSGEIDVDAT
jgi:hypothetical protein